MPSRLLNGPRYWLMDTIEQNDSGAQAHKSFGGMEMIQRATVVVGNPVEASKPYTLNSVDRRTVFSFDAGRTVYELTGPDGTKYVMQSWSQQVEPDAVRGGPLGTRRPPAPARRVVLRRPEACGAAARRHDEQHGQGRPGRSQEHLLHGDLRPRRIRQPAVASVSSSQSRILRLANDRFRSSQCCPAPSASVNSMKVFRPGNAS